MNLLYKSFELAEAIPGPAKDFLRREHAASPHAVESDYSSFGGLRLSDPSVRRGERYADLLEKLNSLGSLPRSPLTSNNASSPPSQ